MTLYDFLLRFDQASVRLEGCLLCVGVTLAGHNFAALRPLESNHDWQSVNAIVEMLREGMRDKLGYDDRYAAAWKWVHV